MGVSIRRATIDDAAAIASLEVVLFPHDAWTPETIMTELRHPDSFYLVAHDDTKESLAGYGGLRASATLGGQGDIQTLAVAGSLRRQKVGSRLLEALLDEARSRAVTEVFLEVRADNEPAISLYRGVGFHEIHRRPGYYQPGSVDAIVMRRRSQDERGGDEQ
jgi:ribosomal-protein-alanine acetyltransferase